MCILTDIALSMRNYKKTGEQSVMKVQSTTWGNIVWDEQLVGDELLSVGMVNIEPHAHLLPHIHYTEQILVVYEGELLSIADGEARTCTPGTILHYPQGVVHEVYNVGPGAAKHLLVSNPNSVKIEIPFFRLLNESTKNRFDYNKTSLLSNAVEKIRQAYLEPLKFPYSIYDYSGKLIAQSELKCKSTCKLGESGPSCQNVVIGKDENKTFFCICKQGYKIINVPIFFDNDFIGYIQGGYFPESDAEHTTDSECSDTPQSTQSAAALLLHKVAETIVSYYEFSSAKDSMEETQKEQSLLKKNIENIGSSLENLKLNNHFIFNTLNAMSLMALESDNMQLYQGIIELSKMMRYTLRTNQKMISFQEEYQYFNSYLNLQKLRFRNRLEIKMDISQKIFSRQIPFNILQPLGENAFTHSFEDVHHKVFEMRALAGSEYMEFFLENNCREISAKKAAEINRQITADSNHAMNIIYRKLVYLYEQDFVFQFYAQGKNRCGVYLKIPYMTKEGLHVTRDYM